MSTGIDDVEWLDEQVCKLSAENAELRASLRCMLALMEMDIEFKHVPLLTPTRVRQLAEAKQLVSAVTSHERGSAMKICKDCRWSKRPWFSPMECRHPDVGPRAKEIDPVAGDIEGGGYWSCGVNRMRSNDGCGYEGRLWEARSSNLLLQERG